MMASSSGSSSPCAACKFLRRKCTPECVFAPYFPPDQPHKFANVHKIFGASNITKLLNELPPHQREDAVNSLAYEADARVKDPVYGCVGAISMLQRQVARLQHELALAQQDLARYSAAAAASIPLIAPPPPPPGAAPPGGPGSPVPVSSQLHHHHHHHHHSGSSSSGSAAVHQLGIGGAGPGGAHDHHLTQQHQQMFSREQLIEIAREQHLTREQVMDIARIGGGSYEAGLQVLGLAPLGSYTPSQSRTSGSDSGGGGGGGGGGATSSSGGFYH